MGQTMTNLTFKIMASIALPIRNLFMPPKKLLAEIEIQPGYRILDFGCGPGTFTIMAAEQTGVSGKVYALDIHPMAVESVVRWARKKNLENIETILSECETTLPDDSLDLVLLLYVFHILDNQREVLAELHRIIKPGALMCFSDHHMREGQILSNVRINGLFEFVKKGEMTYSFRKT